MSSLEDDDRGEELRKELYSLVRTDPRIFDFLQDGSLDGVWYWDLRKPEDEWMSPRFWTTFGYDPTLRRHKASEWQNMIHPEDLAVAQKNVGLHLADPSHPYDQVVRYRGADGNMVWVRCRGIAIFDDDGTPLRMLGAHTDVTALKRAEEQLVRQNATLLETNSDLQALAFAASHDIRSPLRTVLGLLSALEEDYGDQFSRDASELLTLAISSVNRLSDTVTGVVDFARTAPQDAKFETVALSTLLSEIESDLQSVLGPAGCTLKGGELPEIRANAVALQHLFSNLIENAVKFRRPPPTPIEITVEATEVPDGTRILFRDTGVGIPHEYRGRLFKPFTRLHNSANAGGAGLGLAICRRCVRVHGGTIEIDPEYADGTQFNIWIPRKLPDAE